MARAKQPPSLRVRVACPGSPVDFRSSTLFPSLNRSILLSCGRASLALHFLLFSFGFSFFPCPLICIHVCPAHLRAFPLSSSHSNSLKMPSAVDIVIIVLTVALPVLYFFRESLPFIGGRTRAAAPHAPVANKTSVEEGDPSDFVGKMRRAVRVSGMEIGRWRLS